MMAVVPMATVHDDDFTTSSEEDAINQIPTHMQIEQ
jgi:hypothetical protein